MLRVMTEARTCDDERSMKAPTDARRKILDSSIELVAEQGVRAVSFREVARRAGVSHQTPYHHFGDHLGILREIAREGFASLSSAMSVAARRHPDPLHGLEAAGVAYVKFAISHVGHFRVMFQGNLHEVGTADHGGIPEARATFDGLVEIVAAVQATGAGRGLSVETMSLLAWSTVHGLAVLLIEGAMKNDKSDAVILRQVVGGMSLLLAR